MADLGRGLPAGRRRAEGQQLFRNPALAETWKRILAEAEAAGGDRERQIEAACDAFYRGFVAEAIDRFCRNTEVMDATGRRHKRRAHRRRHGRAGRRRYEAPLTL